MLLDLDRGTLAIYKNGNRLGVMMGQLRGAFVWAMVGHAHRVHNWEFVRIDRRTAPLSQPLTREAMAPLGNDRVTVEV